MLFYDTKMLRMDVCTSLDYAGGGGGGDTPLYKPYRYVPPHRVGVLRHFGLKTGIL